VNRSQVRDAHQGAARYDGAENEGRQPGPGIHGAVARATASANMTRTPAANSSFFITCLLSVVGHALRV